ncbi:13918_t:CDS:2 [Dentiscutata erythropus]|uniref:13918_t:CDS:1 n=1 Tax=Dentiscutata erythropus TaxID=1348616 RepID=A0A9N9HCE4_9GLOM|nr:13918_t:CDS:2 [Dentiscutata erythropus]
MLIWFAYAGVVIVLTSFGTSIGFTIFWKVLGVGYLIFAVGAFYGAHAIYYQIPHRVAKFVKAYLIAIIFYIVAEIAYVVVVEIAVNSTIAAAKDECIKAAQKANTSTAICDNIANTSGYSIVGWIIPFLIGTLWQAYLYVCIRSYSLELNERSGEKPVQNNIAHHICQVIECAKELDRTIQCFNAAYIKEIHQPLVIQEIETYYQSPKKHTNHIQDIKTNKKQHQTTAHEMAMPKIITCEMTPKATTYKMATQKTTTYETAMLKTPFNETARLKY